jgi:argininosuccinate lyase
VIIFAQTPLAWVKYPPAFGTGSSMMPNKLNPDAMELLRGNCNSLHTAHDEAVLLLKGLPSGYNRDLQCIKPLIHRTAENAIELLNMTAAFVSELDFDAECLAASLRQGHVNATLQMESLVREGKPLRDAHHAVADEVASSTDGATPLLDDPLQQYATPGSAHPDHVRRVAQDLLDSVGMA